MAPRFSLPLKRTLEVHESRGAHASGLGAESMSTANTRREKKPADESNDLCEKTNIKNMKKEMEKGNVKRKS